MSSWFSTLWAVTGQAPLTLWFPRQEDWSGLPFFPPGDLLYPGIEPSTEEEMVGWPGWTRVSASSRGWWTGKPGVLQSMGSRRIRQDWATELNWTDLSSCSGRRIPYHWGTKKHMIKHTFSYLWNSPFNCA